MFTTKTQTAARIPSTFGMSATGHAFGDVTPAVRAAACVLGTPVVRDAVVPASIEGTISGSAKGYVPGTSVWRPPSC